MIWLTAAAVSAAAVIILSKILPEQRRCGCSRALMLSALFFYAAEIAYRISEGTFNIGTLPLHICSLSVCLMVLNEIFPCPFFEGALFFPCLPGAAAAVIFPDWTSYPPFSLFSSIGFLAHLTIVWYILFKLAIKEIRPRPGIAVYSVLFIALYSAVMIPFDLRSNVNYGFLLTPSPGSPLVFVSEVFGAGAGYYIGYALLALICLVLWYGAWIICGRITQKNTPLA